jgi:hypothetical protein
MANTYTTNNIAYPTTVTSGGYTFNTGAITGGISGSTLTTNGSTVTWTQPSLNFQNSNGKVLMSIPHGKEEIVLEKEATLEVQGTVVINGFDLEERLKIIEQVLLIPERDAKMEAKYPSLKKKFDEYIKLLGKYRTFEAIKGDDDATT